jgi:hypothetical protein
MPTNVAATCAMLHGLSQLFRRSILDEIAGRAGSNGGADHNWVKISAERENGRLRSVRADTLDQSKTGQILAMQSEINHDDVGPVRMVVDEDMAHRGDRCGRLASADEFFVSGPAMAAIPRRQEAA